MAKAAGRAGMRRLSLEYQTFSRWRREEHKRKEEEDRCLMILKDLGAFHLYPLYHLFCILKAQQ